MPPAKTDLGESPIAKAFIFLGHWYATHMRVEIARLVIFLKCPDDKAVCAYISQSFAGGLKQLPAKSQTLIHRLEVKLQNFAAIGKARSAVAAEICITAYAFIELKKQDKSVSLQTILPPSGPAPGDHARELQVRN